MWYVANKQNIDGYENFNAGTRKTLFITSDNEVMGYTFQK